MKFEITQCAKRQKTAPHNVLLDARIEALLRASAEPMRMEDLAKKAGAPLRRVGDRVRRMMQLEKVQKLGARGRSARYRLFVE